MTVAEVAKLLGVSRSTVYQLCERGALPHVRVSNAIRIQRAALNGLRPLVMNGLRPLVRRSHRD